MLSHRDPCNANNDSVEQVLLRERCLLVVSGEAYTWCEHSIPTRAKDGIAPTCCNAAQARRSSSLLSSELCLQVLAVGHHACIIKRVTITVTYMPNHSTVPVENLDYRRVLHQAGAAVGEAIMRAARRISLVFVHKAEDGNM